MAKVKAVQASADIAQINKTLERDGCIVIEGLPDKDEVKLLNDELDTRFSKISEDEGNIPILDATQDGGQQITPQFLQDRNFPVLSGLPQHKNVRVNGHRTSIRLEKEMWDALNEVAAKEGCSVDEVCSAVNELKVANVSFTSVLRAFLFEYYRYYECAES